MIKHTYEYAGLGFAVLLAIISSTIGAGSKLGMIFAVIVPCFFLFAYGFADQSQNRSYKNDFLHVLLPGIVGIAAAQSIVFFQGDQTFTTFFASLTDLGRQIMWPVGNLFGAQAPMGVFQLLLTAYLVKTISNLQHAANKRSIITAVTGILFLAGAVCLWRGIILPFSLTFVCIGCAFYELGDFVKEHSHALSAAHLFRHLNAVLHFIGKHWGYILGVASADIFFSKFYQIFSHVSTMTAVKILYILVTSLVMIYVNQIFFDEEKDELIEKLQAWIKGHQKYIDFLYYALFLGAFAYAFYSETTMFPVKFAENGLNAKLNEIYIIVFVQLIYFFGCMSIVQFKDKKQTALALACILCGLFDVTIWNRWNNWSMITIFMLIVGAKDKSAKTICRVAVISGAVIMGAAMIAAKTGYIANILKDNRQALGMLDGPVCMANFTFLYFISEVGWPRKMTVLRFAICCALIYVFYRLTISRTSLLICGMYTLLKLIVDWKNSGQNHIFGQKMFRGIIQYIYWILTVVSCFLALVLGTLDLTKQPTLILTFIYRQILGREALVNYPIRLFGNTVVEQGAGGLTSVKDFYYVIDNSYIRLLVIYGVLFLLLFLVIHTWLMKDSILKKNYPLMIVLLCLAVASVSEMHLAELSHNVFVILIFCSNNTFAKNAT